GFGSIYKAIWADGRIVKWDHEKNKWHRAIGLIDDNWKYKESSSRNSNSLKTGLLVALKRLNDSSKINDKFLNELKYHLNAFKMTDFLLPLLGITRDPENLEYIIVMNYVHGGSLRNNLHQIYRVNWKKRLFILNSIIFGLIGIHRIRIVHKDLHSGNILMCNAFNENDDWNISLVSDLGLSQPVRFRPQIANHVPQFYASLIKRCWDMDPSKRPKATELLNTIYNCWENYDKNIEDIRDDKIKQAIIQFRNADKKLQEISDLKVQSTIQHSEAYFTSRVINLSGLNDSIAKYKENEE
ncbi:22390_t:CDS:2, partial [Cetraspora pellucida]